VSRGRAVEAAVVPLLVAVLGALLASGVVSDGLTNDEVVYPPAGYLALTRGDFRLEPTHPPLGKLLAAAGLLGAPVAWPAPRPGEDPLLYCHRFFHEANEAGPTMRRARLGPLVLSLGLALLAWWWCRSVAGPVAGALALALLAFHPSLLAHGHLATTDLASAFTFLFGSWTFWRWRLRPSLGRAVVVALAIGIAVNTRLTGVLLVPSLAAVWLLEDRSSRPPARALAVLVLMAAVFVPLVTWGSYGFAYEPWPGATVAKAVSPRLGWGGEVVAWLQDHRLFPEAFLESVRFQMDHALDGHPAYLLGDSSKTGWRWYFLVAFLVKNTPGFLLAVAVLAFSVWRPPLTDARATTAAAPHAPRGVLLHWLVPAAVVFLVASIGRIQIGERYLLPCYPYLALAAALPLARLGSRRFGVSAVAGVLLLHAGPSLRALPHGHLAYFNGVAGGADGGHRVLLDSNLDWGQDLPRLAAWMRRHGVASVQLAYLGPDVPDRLGIVHEDLPGVTLYPPRPPRRPFEGVVVVSPNLLYGFPARLHDPYAFLRGRRPDDRAGVFFVYRFAS
jgi:hypothetical protein